MAQDVRGWFESELYGTTLEIPAFHTNRKWGPFPIGNERFEPKGYPVKINVFQHLYALPNVRDADYQTFLATDADAASRHTFPTRGSLYYPEPQRLLEIQATIWDTLRNAGRQARQLQDGLSEGQWLWPPTEIAANNAGLNLPAQLLVQRYRRMPAERWNRHMLPDAKLFHLDVPSIFSNKQILMMEGRTQDHISFPFDPPDSQLWFFFQGVQQGRERKIAFLGASFLPNEAKQVLLDARTIRPAFEEALRSLSSQPR